MGKYTQAEQRVDHGVNHLLSKGLGFSKQGATDFAIETKRSLEEGSIFRACCENKYLSKIGNWGYLYEGTSCKMLNS